MSTADAPRLVVVGLGHHGRRIAGLLLDRGFALVGAVDPALAGKSVPALLERPAAPEATVVGDVAALAEGVADVAIVTAR